MDELNLQTFYDETEGYKEELLNDITKEDIIKKLDIIILVLKELERKR